MPLTRTKYPARIFSVNPVYGSDNPYKLKDLKNVVTNWETFQRHGSPGWESPQAVFISGPPAADIGIGHDPDKVWERYILSRTDTLSCGQPARNFLQGQDLFAELENVPAEIAELCDSGALRSISAEIWPDYIGPNGRRFGPTLKRISLLGSAPPRLKGMGGIPPFVQMEPAATGRTAQQYVTVFSEAPFMSEEEARKVFADLGIEITADIPAAFVIAMAVKLKELVPPAPEPEPEPAPVPVPEVYADRMLARIMPAIRKEMNGIVQPVLTGMGEMQRSFGGIAANAERQKIDAFADQNRAKLYPFELDPASEHNIVKRLLAMPAAVREVEMKTIANRPAVSTFAERITADHGGMSRADMQGEHGRIVGASDGAPSADRVNNLLRHSAIHRAEDRRKAAAELRKKMNG